MFTKRIMNRLMLAALVLGVGLASAQAETATPDAGAVAEYLRSSKPSGDIQVAQASTDKNMSTTGSFEEPTSGSAIQMDLAEPESDVLTRAAIDKLDAEIGSLTFKDTDLADVIRFIGKKLDLNFIFDANVVKGKVTLTFRNVRVRDALNSILSAQKLAMVPDKSGIFRIVPQAMVGGNEVETRTEVVQLNWVQAADVQKSMKTFLSDHGKMEVNEESNVLIITDVPPNLENIKDMIVKLDEPERQVMIEARLVDINLGAARTLGSRLSLSKANNNLQGGATIPATDALGVVNNLLTGISVGADGTGHLAFGDAVNVLGNQYNLNAAFDMLETNQIVQVLANPRVSTLNNVPANIKIVQQVPYVSAAQVNNGTTTEQVEFKESGVEVTVKPIITPNGFIRMEITMAQKINRGRVGSDALAPPLIDERDAQTNVIVSSGNTAVLGGLRQLDAHDTINGVPWFNRVPVLGWFFKNRNHDAQKTELVLMITPNIIERGQPMSDHESELYKRIDKNWHKDDYFMMDGKTGTKDSGKI